MSLWRRLFRGSRGLPEPPPFVDEAFAPANALERVLASGDAAELARALPASRVFVPSLEDATRVPEGAPFRPILLDTDVGPCVVALTSAERLKALLPAVPGVQSGIEVEASWVLAQCAEGVGLAIDPGWREGVVLPPDEVARLR